MRDALVEDTRRVSAHAHAGGHGHSHGLVSASIRRSKAGLRAVSVSLVVLLVTASAQAVVFALTGSVALLADLIHNFGDALTAIPLGVAFVLRSFKAEKGAGYFVVATIFISACVALGESIERLMHPQTLSHLWALAAAGAIGFVGNEAAAWVRLRAGKRLQSPALVADGYHARTDGLVSLAVVLSAAFVALGLGVADPIIGLIVTAVILRITWQSFNTVRTDPGEPEDRPTDGIVPPSALTATSTLMTMATRTTTETRRLRTRAERILAAEQLRAPATRANTARNARAEYDRHARWAPAREALWRFLDIHLPDGPVWRSWVRGLAMTSRSSGSLRARTR